jgi:hypothetical protein
MTFLTVTESDHNHGLDVASSNREISTLWLELKGSIESIAESEIIERFERSKRNAKSISEVLNQIIDEKLVGIGWKGQSKIFKGDEYENSKTWTLDFSKTLHSSTGKSTGIAVEVAFNHGEAIAWNLVKPALAAQKNHVSKEVDIGVGIGVYICATKEMKELGGFDGAVGEYEKVLRYLEPLSLLIQSPFIIVGIQAPKTFYIERYPKDYVEKKLRGRSTGRLITIN